MDQSFRISAFTKFLNVGIICCSIYAIYLTTVTIIHEPYWLLPVTYAFLFTICPKNKAELGRSPGNTTLNIIIALRYLLLPIIVMSSGEYGGIVKDYSHLTEGIYLMTYELLAVFLANEYFLRKIKPKYKNTKLHNFSFKKRDLTILLSVVVLMLLLVSNPSFVGGFGLITQGFVETEASSEQRSSFVSILWQALTTWTYVYLVLYQKMKYEKTSENVYVYNSLFLSLGFILITFIAQNQISRWYTIISSVAALFLLLKLFPAKRKTVSAAIVSPVVLLITTVTIYKNVSTDADLNYDTAESVITSSGFLNAYLGGPSSVNNAIGLYESGNVGIANMPNDMLNNMPIINHFLTPGQTTVYKYNDYIGRIWDNHSGDQIIPLIGQGLAYFGPIFCVLITIVMVFLVRFLDIKYHTSDSTFMFMVAFMASWFGVEMCLNMTINLSWIYIRIFPMWLLFYLAEKIKL